MAHSPSTMVGPALDGKPIQPTTPLLSAHTIPLVLNGMHKSISKHQSTALQAVIPNPVQVATQLPVQQSNQQASPNVPTMKTPHTTPESYQNFK